MVLLMVMLFLAPTAHAAGGAIAVGLIHSLALGSDGKLYAWGPTIQAS